MKIKTSKGLEYIAQWAGESLGKQGRLLVQLEEVRPLVQLVAEFDGIDWMETSGPDGQPDRRMDGPMALSGASRLNNGQILITMEKR